MCTHAHCAHEYYTLNSGQNLNLLSEFKTDGNV